MNINNKIKTNQLLFAENGFNRFQHVQQKETDLFSHKDHFSYTSSNNWIVYKSVQFGLFPSKTTKSNNTKII